MDNLGKCAKHLLVCRKYLIPTIQPVRTSMYGASYMEPTFRREDLLEPLDEVDPRRFKPIKAAKNEQTTSMNHDEVVLKFIRQLTKKGDKRLARLIMDKTFENIKLTQLEKFHKADDEDKQFIELNPYTIFHQAVENCKPLLITQPVKRGGVIYQVPIPVKPKYQLFRAVKWLIESSDEKQKSIRFWDQLPYEILDAARNEGKSVRKKQELHRICEANKAYAHFRW